MDADVKTESTNKRLNDLVAVTVVVLSVFMAVSNIKGGNIGQNMALAKADAVDSWAEYQAGRIKLHMDEDVLATLKLSPPPGADPAAVATEMARLQKQIDRYESKSAALMKKAKDNEALYEELNVHDDQFDLSDALLSMALALSAVAALTAIEWVLYVGWAFSAAGLLMGIAGFAGWGIRLEFLSALLG